MKSGYCVSCCVIIQWRKVPVQQMETGQEVFMAIQHIIFDLDGTLMDTEKGNLYAWQKTLRYYVPLAYIF